MNYAFEEIGFNDLDAVGGGYANAFGYDISFDGGGCAAGALGGAVGGIIAGIPGGFGGMGFGAFGGAIGGCIGGGLHIVRLSN